MARRQRGYSLIEIGITLVVAAVLASLAWPSLQAQWLRARRADAVDALLRVQKEQERHRIQHGLYALQLGALRGFASERSPQGLYAVRIESTSPDGYVAAAMAQGRQQADAGCERLTLTVTEGFAQMGPTRACWNR